MCRRRNELVGFMLIQNYRKYIRCFPLVSPFETIFEEVREIRHDVATLLLQFTVPRYCNYIF